MSIIFGLWGKLPISQWISVHAVPETTLYVPQGYGNTAS